MIICINIHLDARLKKRTKQESQIYFRSEKIISLIVAFIQITIFCLGAE